MREVRPVLWPEFMQVRIVRCQSEQPVSEARDGSRCRQPSVPEQPGVLVMSVTVELVQPLTSPAERG